LFEEERERLGEEVFIFEGEGWTEVEKTAE